MNLQYLGTLFLRPTALVAAAAMAACGGSNSYAPRTAFASARSVPAPQAATKFPGKSAVGIAAHYVVFQRKISKTSATIDVVPVQEIASYLLPFGSLTSRLPGAVIEYPDGSTQSVDARAEFDAGASSYARSHPESLSGKDTTVRVHPPKGSTLASIVAAVYAPSETQEKEIVSGVIPSETTTSIAAPANAHAAIWSCDPKDYAAKTLQVVRPNQLTGDSFVVKDESVWYKQQFYTCGTDQLSTRISWSAARWEHISAGFGTNAHTRWSVDFITTRFYGDQVALSAKPDNASFADERLSLIGQ